MNAPEQRLTTAVRDLLLASRPPGTPEDFTIRAQHDTAKLEKPCLVISASNSESPHPVVRKLNLTITTQRRADDETTAPPEELHQRFVNALESNLPALAETLQAQQLRILKIAPPSTAEEIAEGRTGDSTAQWTVFLQIL